VRAPGHYCPILKAISGGQRDLGVKQGANSEKGSVKFPGVNIPEAKKKGGNEGTYGQKARIKKLREIVNRLRHPTNEVLK